VCWRFVPHVLQIAEAAFDTGVGITVAGAMTIGPDTETEAPVSI
jgi:hypothetical protein